MLTFENINGIHLIHRGDVCVGAIVPTTIDGAPAVKFGRRVYPGLTVDGAKARLRRAMG